MFNFDSSDFHNRQDLKRDIELEGTIVRYGSREFYVVAKDFINHVTDCKS